MAAYVARLTAMSPLPLLSIASKQLKMKKKNSSMTLASRTCSAANGMDHDAVFEFSAAVRAAILRILRLADHQPATFQDALHLLQCSRAAVAGHQAAASFLVRLSATQQRRFLLRAVCWLAIDAVVAEPSDALQALRNPHNCLLAALKALDLLGLGEFSRFARACTRIEQICLGFVLSVVVVFEFPIF